MPIILTLSIILILLGLFGIVVPMVPGLSLIFLGILIYAIFTNFTTISFLMIISLLLLVLMGLAVDYLSGFWGAKKLGATKYGIWGGIIGILIGIIFVPFGFVSLILLPIIGTVIGELIGGQRLLASSKIGFGAFLGFLVGALINILIAAAMITIFILAVF